MIKIFENDVQEMWINSPGVAVSAQASVNNSHNSSNGSTTVVFPLSTFNSQSNISLLIDKANQTYQVIFDGITCSSATFTITDDDGTTVTNGPWTIPPTKPQSVSLPMDRNRLTGSITDNTTLHVPMVMKWDLLFH